MTRSHSRQIAVWLLIVAALIFIMVIVGGVTRLTRSGLSIVEWNPVMGAIPPLTEQQWSMEFTKYQQTPEYAQINTGMTLDGFKKIFYVEWMHRLLGRLIGFAFLLPLIYFAVRRMIDRALLPKLIGVFILGGLQGALGWFMVKSGLVDIPRVSPYRLTAHLGLAIVIYGYLVWVALSLLYPKKQKASPQLREPLIYYPSPSGRGDGVRENVEEIRKAAPHPGPLPEGEGTNQRFLRQFGWFMTGLIFLTILAGGFVAGTKAGFAFNTWPLMYGHLVPDGFFALAPWWTNFFENIPTVQFDHRMLAYTVLVVVAVYAWIGLRQKTLASARWGFALLPVAALTQAVLGISTLLLSVPVSLGAAHQAGALALFTVALYLNHRLRDA